MGWNNFIVLKKIKKIRSLSHIVLVSTKTYVNPLYKASRRTEGKESMYAYERRTYV